MGTEPEWLAKIETSLLVRAAAWGACDVGSHKGDTLAALYAYYWVTLTLYTIGFMKRIYLDTVLISALVKNDIPLLEINALKAIQELHQRGLIKCYVSEKVRQELADIPEEYQKLHLEIFNLFEMAETFKNKRVMDIIGGGMIPFPREEPLLLRLKQIFKADDAEHIFQAFQNKCFFLTVDGGILRGRDRIETTKSIKILRPSELAI